MAASLLHQRHDIPRAGQYASFSQPPRPPPSPPMEESRCSLPSISNLLGLADAGSPTSETSPTSMGPSSRLEDLVQRRQDAPYMKQEARPAHPKITPPSPPMSTDASFDSGSPTSKSVSQFSNASAQSPHWHEATPPLESEQQRHQLPAGGMPRPGYVQQPTTYAPTPAPVPYASQPPMGTYYAPAHAQAPAQPQSQVSGLHYQRPLPQSFPPPLAIPMGAPSTHPWQHHHHYMNPSHGGPFPQSQDRYICQTCNKAFSRPSSLRIHSHSHTGEKPFKCPHAGCGKAFSVRSNMKRHERGCHSFEVSGTGPALTA